uniref:Disease resistance R13L4/SHOC-2-like LRR domain-containing protein n=1 Tax=Oryza meridionalis TaxID=40149 RepID=A0A0E0F760_9ORYZ
MEVGKLTELRILKFCVDDVIDEDPGDNFPLLFSGYPESWHHWEPPSQLRIPGMDLPRLPAWVNPMPIQVATCRDSHGSTGPGHACKDASTPHTHAANTAENFVDSWWCRAVSEPCRMMNIALTFLPGAMPMLTKLQLWLWASEYCAASDVGLGHLPASAVVERRPVAGRLGPERSGRSKSRECWKLQNKEKRKSDGKASVNGDVVRMGDDNPREIVGIGSHLPLLNRVKVVLDCEGATGRQVEEAEAALRRMVKSHPNRPAIGVYRLEERLMKRDEDHDDEEISAKDHVDRNGDDGNSAYTDKERQLQGKEKNKREKS